MPHIRHMCKAVYNSKGSQTQSITQAVAKKMRCALRQVVEPTFLAPVYRAARDEWLWARRTFLETPFGFRLAGPTAMQAGKYESDEVQLIRRLLAQSDIFVDVGANVGYFTCLALSMQKPAVAVEPFPNNVRYRCANLEANGWTSGVEVHPVGLAESTGISVLYGSGTGASLLRGWAGVSSHFRTILPMSTLDIILGNRFQSKRMLIKMDVEGAEHAVLQGASNILKAIPQAIWIIEITLTEHRPVGRNNPLFLKTFELMWGHGYCARSLTAESKVITPEDVREYLTSGRRPVWATTNYLFIGDKYLLPHWDRSPCCGFHGVREIRTIAVQEGTSGPRNDCAAAHG